jgi:hypothetical protein
LFLKKLVGSVLDRIDLYPEFNPRQDYALTISSDEMNAVESAALTADDLDLKL